MSELNVYVHLDHNLDTVEYEKLFNAGKAPDLAPYGFHLAKDFVASLTFSISHKETILSKILRKVFKRILGFDLLHAFRNRKKFEQCDIAWTMTENEFLGLLFLKTLFRNKYNKKVICQIIWFANYYKPSLRNRFKQYLMKSADVVLTHSNRCLPILEKVLPDQNVMLMHFGVSPSCFPIIPPSSLERDESKIRIFSAGNDKTRDWKTILDAFGNDDRFEVTIVCKWIDKRLVSKYSNVTLLSNPTMQDFNEHYINSSFVVVSMFENVFSGITVALEAIATGACLVSSDTGGINTYFDSTEVLYFPVGNAEALRNICLNTTPKDRLNKINLAQMKFSQNDYHNSGMINRYLKISNSLFNK